MIKISQIISILMSEKISVTRINKGFSQKYVKVVYPLKLGIKNINNHCKNAMVIFFDYLKIEGMIEIRRKLWVTIDFEHFLGYS